MNTLAEAVFNEDGISRILSHVNDDDTFAIIGSQDKDTKENRFDELLSLIRNVASKEKKIGWKYIEGTYTYEDGTTGLENSIIVYNISKEDALRTAKLLNQESIIWKDKDFFGFLTSDGIEDGELGRGMSFDKDKANMYGSKLLGKHNKAKAFVFEVLESSIKGNTFSKHKIDKIKRIPVMEIKRMEKKTISIQEELSKLDRSDSDKFYDLRRLYESVNLSVDKKKELAKMLVNESVDSKDVYDFLQGKEIKRDKLVESLNDSRNTLVEENANASFTVPEDIEIGASYETISGYITRESENKYKVFDEDGMYVDWTDNFKDAYELSISIYDIGEEDPYWEEQREKDKEDHTNGDSWDEDDESNYTFLRRKTVTDYDGFTTDYAWYVSPDGTNVFVFGDMDYYRPEDGNFDFETESNKEAKEWFDNYKGPGEEDENLDFDEDLEQSPEQLTKKSTLIENIKNTCKNCIFYEENGTDVIEEFIINQPSKMAAKICYNFMKLNDLGKNARYPLTRHLGDGIFEMRTDFASDTTRCLFFFIYGNEMVFTNGFVKKSDKTPPNEIELAKNRRNTYINNNESSGEM